MTISHVPVPFSVMVSVCASFPSVEDFESILEEVVSPTGVGDDMQDYDHLEPKGMFVSFPYIALPVPFLGHVCD